MSEPLKICCRGCHAKYDVSDLPPFTEFECPECGIRLRTPKRFGRYLLEKICGGGGMSLVYRAIDPLLARRVAIKIMRSKPEVRDFGKRFIEEAKLFGRISHPAVVPIYDCGEMADEEFLVMQFMNDGDLERKMKAGVLPELPVLIAHLRGIAEGLQCMWTQEKIVHHDVKPSNILFNSDGEAKLADFDLADVREAGDLVTQCPQYGSPAYVSPERLLGGGEDYRGDVFSLGVTTYELLAGHAPFSLTGDTAVLYEERRRLVTPLLMLNPAVGPELSALVERMIAFEPEDRPGYPEVVRKMKLSGS